MQTHSFHELTYYMSGNGSTQIGDTVYPYQSKTFAFYRAGTVHNELNPEPCNIIWSHFDFQIDSVDLKEGIFHDPDGELLACLQKLRNAYFEQRAYREELIESTLAETILTAARLQKEMSVSPSGIGWAQILDYIDENSNGTIDFAALAEKNHYSYERFRHLFKEHFGISLYAYLTSQRVEHAKCMLRDSSFNMTNIAYDCGFNSSSQFTNIFKKYTGMTPGQYRKRGCPLI